MKDSLVHIFLLSLFLITFVCCNQQIKWEDDRLCKTPANDSILEDMINRCKRRELQFSRPEVDTSIFFVSFNVFNHNDTDKVWVMGDFSNPVFLHDSAQWGMDNYLGCFKRRNTFCFFYKCVLSSQKNVKESTRVVSFLLKDWRLRTPYDNPEFFPKDISGTIRDPYIFEYMVDSIGSLSLLRKGHW